MHRIDNSTAVAGLPTPKPPGTAGYFSGGNPTTGSLATIVSADWANAVQEEIVNVILGASIALSKTDRSQLLAAIQRLGGGFRGTAVFSTPGTTVWNVPANVTALEVHVYGGGGSGAGAVATPAGQAAVGAGGNGGAYATKRLTGLTPGAAVAVTVGAGGARTAVGGAGNPGTTSSFGAYCSAPGGYAKGAAPAFTPPMMEGPFAQAQFGTGGDLNGGTVFGGWGVSMVINNSASGNGGGNNLGDGARAAANNSDGYDAAVAGTGGSGAVSSNGGTAYSGGAGSPGLVIIKW